MNAINPIAGLLVVAYVGVVFWRGNVENLANSLLKESGYIEFLAAAYILSLLVKSKQVGAVVTPIVLVAVVAVLLRVSTSPVVESAIADFGAGKIGMFDALVRIFGTSEKSAVLSLPGLNAPLLRSTGPNKE